MNSPALDDSELVHLGLHALRQNRDDEAISFFKRAIELAPGNAKAHYLLGAEHAQLGLYERAIQEMSRAVELEPGLAAARFQLGLLHFTTGHACEAQAVWQPLERLPAGDPLSLFSLALLNLSPERTAEYIAQLKDGITNNTFNEALNDDMRQLLAKLESALGKPGSTAAPPDASLPVHPAGRGCL